MGALISVLNKNGENATQTAVTMLKMLKPKKAETFGIASPTTVRIEKTVEDLQNKEIKSHVIIGHIFSKILDQDKPQPLRLKNATLVFEGRIYPPIKGMTDSGAAAKKLQQNHEEAAKTFIKNNKGDFVFVIAEPERLITGRDSIGAQPLYYGENADLMALTSERKALWKIGIEKTESFPPGYIAIANKNGFKFKPIKTLTYSKPKRTTMRAAAKELQTLLQHSIKERVLGLKEVVVAFSGGLDSSLIAFLAKKSNVNVHLIHVSLENQPETKHAKKIAEELKLPMQAYLFKEEDVEKIIPKVVTLIEESDPIKTSIGVPFYWAAEKTAEMEFKVMLAGQGADELFGGYKRYVDDYLRYGSEKTGRRIFEDVTRLYETNLERDAKICNFHNVELRLPFATHEIAKLAIALPTELKIEPQQNALRKLVLRRVAENLGLPESVVKKPKKAMQYTTGINNALKRIAKRNGLTVREYLHKVFQETINKMM